MDTITVPKPRDGFDIIVKPTKDGYIVFEVQQKKKIIMEIKK